MRRNCKSITTSPEIVKHIDGLTEANFNLLTRLIEWLAANEKAQRKSRLAEIGILTKIDAAISLLLVGQQAQTQSKPPLYFADKLKEGAKDAEEFISNQSKQVVLKLLRYIYGEDRAPAPRRDRRRKWHGWEI
jgi:hypothetical protein